MPILEIERIHLQKSQNNGKSLHPTVLVLADPQVGQEFFIHLIDDRLQIRRTAPAAGATQRAAFTTSGNELPAESFTHPSPPPHNFYFILICFSAGPSGSLIFMRTDSELYRHNPKQTTEYGKKFIHETGVVKMGHTVPNPMAVE